MNKILVFCKKYNQNPADKYLTNELIEELIAQGHEVTVFALGDVEFHESRISNVKEFLYPIKGRGMFSKYLFVWPKASARVLSMIFNGEKFDKLIAFAPLSVIFPLVFFSRFLSVKKRICIIFDLFPIHQQQLGRFNEKTSQIFKNIERYLLNSFDVVTGMTKENTKQITSYYHLKKSIDIKILPIWGFNPLKDNKFIPPHKSVNMIFGGQIVPGRSIDQLIKLIILLRNQNVSVTLTLFSKGDGFEKLKQEYAKYTDFIFFKDRVPRDEYVKLISNYDLGAIVTDPRVSMPTFPSKIIDYFNAGLPCFCMIENKSDIGEVINDNNLIHINNFNFSKSELNQIKKFINKIHMNTQAYDFSSAELFSSKNAVKSLINF